MTLPFVMPSPDVFFSASKRVFSHYFPSFPLSIDNQPSATDYYNRNYLVPSGEGGKFAAQGGYLRARPLPVPVGPVSTYQLNNMETEVSLAIARGITGFTFDILSYSDAISATGRLQAMFTAASKIDTRFKVLPMIDMSTAYTAFQIQTIIASCNSMPSVFREDDGRMVFAVFNAVQPLSFWQPIIQALNAQDINVAFIPIFLGNPAPVNALSPISIGAGGWGTATPAAAATAGCFMTPILSQQFRPKDAIFWESDGSDTFRASWASALNSGPYVQIITWNDFSESGQIQPYTDATLANNIGTAFYDLTAYYAMWFATGSMPILTGDRIYWFYRRMASNAAHLNQPDAFKCISSTETSNIEALSFLAAPGTVLINGQAFPCPAGITSCKAPTAPGNPTFALQRNGSNVFQGVGPVTIYGPEGAPSGVLDMTYWGGSIP
jgi:hypothetical protein